MKLILALLFTFSVLAANESAATTKTPAEACKFLLRVPERFRHAFVDYKDSRFLQTVDQIRIAFEDGESGQVIHHVVLDAVTNKTYLTYETKISAQVNFNPDNKSIGISEISISNQFSEEYGLKLFLALYLVRYPKIKTIRTVILSTLPVSYSILRENLSRGVSLKDALPLTPFFKAASALGYTNFDGSRLFTPLSSEDTSPSTFGVQIKASQLESPK